MSELVGKSTRKVIGHLSVTAAVADRLEELAAEAGIPRTRLAALLLEELVPTISGVRQRLQVTRNGAKPDA